MSNIKITANADSFYIKQLMTYVYILHNLKIIKWV